MTMLGHNVPAFDLGEFIDRVLDAPLSGSEKLIQIVLGRLAQKEGGTVTPRRADVLQKASCSEATFKRSFTLLKAFFEVEKRTGNTTQYSIKPIATQDEIAAAIAALRKSTKGHHDTTSRDHSDTTSERPQDHSDTTKLGITMIPGSESKGLGDTTKKEKSPHTPLKENIYINNSLPVPEPRERERGDFVDVNCTAINVQVNGRRLSYDYQAIALWASMGLCGEETARQIVEAEARGWMADGKIPDQPSRWLQSQISKWRTRKTIAETQIANARKRGSAEKPKIYRKPNPWD